MIHDPRAFPEPPAFDWLDGAAAEDVPAAGRGSVRRLVTAAGPVIHRHYRRGGRVAVLLDDRYWFGGFDATRAAREFRLLDTLYSRGQRVPRPVLARVQRSGLFYRADLVTAEVGASTSLASLLATVPDQLPWNAVAQAVADLHHAGVWHADLNAHNVLVDDGGQAWLIDFDRAEERLPRLQWREDNLDRLHRSLVKLGAERLVRGFGLTWQGFLDAYAQAFAQRKREHLT